MTTSADKVRLYQPRSYPKLDGGFPRYLATELSGISLSIASLRDAIVTIDASAASPYVTISGHLLGLGGVLNLVASDVGLGSVTNDQQTKAAIVPNTVPNNGQVLVGNGGVYAPVALSGDGFLGPTGGLTVTRLNGVSPGPFYHGTDAASLTGTVQNARLSGAYTGITQLGVLLNLACSDGTTTLAFNEGSGANYIESGNAAWTASADFHICGYNGNLINNLWLTASNIHAESALGLFASLRSTGIVSIGAAPLSVSYAKILEARTAHAANIDDEIFIGSDAGVGFGKYGVCLNYQISSGATPAQYIGIYSQNIRINLLQLTPTLITALQEITVGDGTANRHVRVVSNNNYQFGALNAAGVGAWYGADQSNPPNAQISNNSGTPVLRISSAGVLTLPTYTTASNLGVDSAGNVLATGRESLTNNRDYYVSTTGNDANTGLSSSAPLLTLQQCCNVISKLDFNGWTVTVHIADGTYTAGWSMNGRCVGQVDETKLVIVGNTASPTNVLISTTSGPGFQATNGAMFSVGGVKLQCVYDLYAEFAGSKIIVNAPIYADTINNSQAIYFYARRNGYIEFDANVDIVNPSGWVPQAVWECTHGARIWLVSGVNTFYHSMSVGFGFFYVLTPGSDLCITGTASLVHSGVTLTGYSVYADGGAMQQVPENYPLTSTNFSTLGVTTRNGGQYITS